MCICGVELQNERVGRTEVTAREGQHRQPLCNTQDLPQMRNT